MDSVRKPSQVWGKESLLKNQVFGISIFDQLLEIALLLGSCGYPWLQDSTPCGWAQRHLLHYTEDSESQRR